MTLNLMFQLNFEQLVETDLDARQIIHKPFYTLSHCSYLGDKQADFYANVN